MPTYVIGDVQGCYDPLQALLGQIGFDARRDMLWFVGDLVNRGPRSLEVLRFVRSLGERAVTVLGNHDLHLVAAARGFRSGSKKDTLDGILNAPDARELVDWVRQQSVLHEVHGVAGGVTRAVAMVHAGIPPQWSMHTARACARELEAVLRDERKVDAFLAQMYGDTPSRWSEDLRGKARLRYITNAFTRMRYVDRTGRLDFTETRPPGSQPKNLIPWFEAPDRHTGDTLILFGHWATLQLLTPLDAAHGVRHLDSGCVWGGTLSALRLDDGAEFSVPGWSGGRKA